jgi:excisionase family DNA binding protein
MIKYYTVKETAEIFRRSVRTILRWIDEGYLRSNKVKDGHLISEIEINRILNSKPEIRLPE